MRADFPFFPSFDERGEQLGGDVRLLAEGASRGWVAAAKDVSMAGLVGSLAMLLECNRLGVTVDLDALPVLAGVSLEQWPCCFPCFAFPDRVMIARALDAGNPAGWVTPMRSTAATRACALTWNDGRPDTCSRWQPPTS